MNPTAPGLLRDLSTDFLDKYNKQGPRYTSYPTAPEWKDSIGQEAYRAVVREDASRRPEAPLSLYIHIPFCKRRCRFCACYVIISKESDSADPYLRQVDQEMALLASEMGPDPESRRPLAQLHFGGGTPTFLRPEQLENFMGKVRRHFRFLPDAEISLEADPSVTSVDHIQMLRKLGFNRLSFGVQDFHPPTQKVIDRIQTKEETQELTELARSLGYKSVNYDLIYGLPYQTLDSFNTTLDKTLELSPDRIALYNFAYLPERLGHQKLLPVDVMPTGPEKYKIFVTAYERFLEAGYRYIGMDHFAKPGDSLSLALDDGSLQRNFMGYTTRAGTDLYSFGVSSISITDGMYVQNTKKLSEHAARVEAGQLPIERGMILSDEDRLRRSVIYGLMCQGKVRKEDVEKQFDINFDKTFGDELKALEPLARDGLVALSQGEIQVTLLGFVFVRNVAMVFDAYLRKPGQKIQYSKTL